MIILDTHTWLWWVSNPENLSLPARKIIDSTAENDEILISSISAWEVALLVAKRRLQLTIEVSDWIAKSERLPFVKFIPIEISARELRMAVAVGIPCIGPISRQEHRC